MKHSYARFVTPLVVLLCFGSMNLQSTTAQPEGVGEWSSVIKLPLRGIHAILLPTGNVMLFTVGPEQPQPFLFAPLNSALQSIDRPGYEIFCSSHNLLADGKLLIIGGRDKVNTAGLPNITLYDPFNNTFTRQKNMNLGRWYPSSIQLGDNRVLIIAGTYLDAESQKVLHNRLPQVYYKGNLKTLTGAKGTVSLYPRLALMADGRVFIAGPSQYSKYLDPNGRGQLITGPTRTFTSRDAGALCQYEDGKLLYMGGGDPPTDTAEVIDLNQPDPQWRQLSSRMIAPRRHLNSTLLPDGKVLITGGVSGAGFNNTTTPVLTAEVWDPATEEFTPLSDMATGRWYHSTTLMLPDGRLLCSGGEDSLNAEIYSPPYLFQGRRPYISGFPSVLYYGKSYEARFTSINNIVAMNLIKLSSVTHSVNFDQRIVRLSFSRSGRTLQFTLPTNPNLCPPGYYMLFVIDKSGRPSVGKIVRVRA